MRNTITKKTRILLAAGAMILGLGACRKPDFLKGRSVGQTFTVSSVSPLEGEPGTTVHIKGTGFSTDSTRNKVYVNGKNAPILTYSDTSLVITVPETNTVTSQIRVIVDSVPAHDAYTFRYRDVYVAGYVSNATGPSVARLWKNGVVQPFFTDSARFIQAKSVFVDGTDVYVGTNQGYLVNSTFVSVDPDAKYKQQFVNDIKVHDGIVYATYPLGYVKDGEPVRLLEPSGVQSASINKIVFDGDSIYVAGTLRAPNGPQTAARLFKNDLYIPLTPNYRYADANSVAIYNGSSFTVGNVLTDTYIWIDGQGKKFQYDSFGTVNSLTDILYIGEDQYISASGSKRFVYLKNRAVVKYDGQLGEYFSSTALAASGSDIYACGTTSLFNSDATDAQYCKNTTLFKMDKGSYLRGAGNAIAVVTRK